MKAGYTHISMLLDRSGSMSHKVSDVIGGFNSLVEKQKVEPGTCTLSAVQFDTVDRYEVIHDFLDLQEVPELTKSVYFSRGGTPLVDALAQLIISTGTSLSALPEKDRPEKVIVVIFTDGQENSSVEYKKADVTKLIKQQEEKYNWDFMFMGADLASVGEAQALGLANVIQYVNTSKGTGGTYAYASRALSARRLAPADERLQIGSVCLNEDGSVKSSTPPPPPTMTTTIRS